MIKRLYVNNYKCLVSFETEFDRFGVLCGPNGSGKSSVFDALRLVRNLATGDCILGGDGERDVSHLEFTNWQQSTTQEFEIEINSQEHVYQYLVHIEQKAEFEVPRIIKEEASYNGKSLFTRTLEGVTYTGLDGSLKSFPLDWRQAALAVIHPKGALKEVGELQEEMRKILIVRPDPRSMEKESKAEIKYPDLNLMGLTSWYRYLSQDFEWTQALHGLLQEIWVDDYQSLRLLDVGRNTKALQFRFGNGRGAELFFEQLSDGEKALVGLYMILASLETGAIQTIFIDEPDNYVGLPELQPWILLLRECLEERAQAIFISHHPEVLSSSGKENGRYLWRDNHSSPTRIGKLSSPEGISLGEAVARGWVKHV